MNEDMDYAVRAVYINVLRKNDSIDNFRFFIKDFLSTQIRFNEYTIMAHAIMGIIGYPK